MTLLTRFFSRVSPKNSPKQCLKKCRQLSSYDMLHFPQNEPLTDYSLETGQANRQSLKKSLLKLKEKATQIPLVINGREIFNDTKKAQYMPSEKNHTLAEYSNATPAQINDAISGAVAAQDAWENIHFNHKAKIFAKAAHLIRTKYRYDMMAATMLGQAKTVYQADIDCICELIDFIEFNLYYVQEVKKTQKLYQPLGQMNSLEFRALEGFVAAIAPFNFTAISANLAATPCMTGNVVLWKPSSTAVLSSYIFYKALMESGMPDGVIQFIPCRGADFGEVALKSRHLSAVNFTGSNNTFNSIWKTVGANVENYRGYPRLMGECGGKNYHFVHPSAVSDVDHIVNSTIRSAFEYSGQKCSACSRIYLPESQWEQYKDKFVELMKGIKLGQPDHPETFLSAVIDQESFGKITKFIDSAKNNEEGCEIVCGGHYDESVGYFVEPTVVLCPNDQTKIMKTELFGPVLAVCLYKDDDWKQAIAHISRTSEFGLTGSIFSNDRNAIIYATEHLRHTAGNFYINDKSTGSIVAQQPFGGSRKSGTNDKPGMFTYPLRFTSPFSCKEFLSSLDDYNYPHMKGDSF